MEKSLIRRLLQICRSSEERFSRSKGLSQFMQDYNIGQVVGVSAHFSAADKADIRALLLKTEDIDVASTAPEQWEGLSRTESLAFASNEKLTNANVRDRRVAIKHLPQRTLLLDGKSLVLPDGSNLDMDWYWLAQHCQHSSVLVVENWEAFDLIHQVQIDLSVAGENPLVMFRGSPVYQQNHTFSLLEAMQLPVFAFVDFDPAGLVLAQNLPCFQDIIMPPLDLLQAALVRCTNHERYQGQLPAAGNTLDNTTHLRITQLWRLLQLFGVALPQEYFIQP